MTARQRTALQRALLRWYAAQGRDLPWRNTRDPYKIFVSEVMLQQTQVDRVQPRYEQFIKRWPTVRALARARRASVLRLWSGLGYNRRAVNLHRAAQEVVKKYKGKMPIAIAALEALPGIGHYTARAVAGFSGHSQAAFIDTNIRRIIARVTKGQYFPTPANDRELLFKATQLLPPQQALLWHHALMDLGSAICKPLPKCEVCPLNQWCLAYPKILKAPRRRASSSQKFSDSNRYWRGSVVRLLTALPHRWYSTIIIHRQLPNGRRLGRSRLNELLTALVKDGLLVQQTKRFRLP